MATTQNRASSRRIFLEMFSEGRLDVADQVCTADHHNDEPYAPPGGWPRGPEGMKAAVSVYRTGFPDLAFTVEDQVAEGGTVVTRWTARGVHNGPLPDMPATGRPVVVTGITIDHYEGEKQYGSWTNWDMMGMMQQLGVIPAPGT